MPDILVDPVLLTFSISFTTDEQKAEYLQLLNRWAEAASETRGAYIWHCSDKLVYLLQSNGLFPDFKTLLQLQKAYNAVFPAGPPIDIRRIQNWLQHIVDSQCENEFTFNNPAVEALAHATFVDAPIDVESQKTTFQPSAFASRWHPQIQQQATDLFARLCACAHLGYSYAPDLHIATKDFQPDLQLQGTTSVRVDTTLYYLPVAQPAEENFQYIHVFHTFPLLFSLTRERVIEHEWEWNGTEADLRAAIDREYEKRYRNIVEELQRARQAKQGKKKASKQEYSYLPFAYTFGSHFIELLQEVRRGTARENLPKRFVEAAAAIIADQVYFGSKYHAKSLRESEGGGVAAYERGRDIAMRVYITVSHGGWRLNYWRGSDESGRGRIEFSVIQKTGDKARIDYD